MASGAKSMKTNQQISVEAEQIAGAEQAWPTIVIIEDDAPAIGLNHGMPECAHYYHEKTLAAAIDHAQTKGCHKAKAWCYDTVRYTHCPRDAKQMEVIPV